MNLSHESLTSKATLRKLTDLQQTHPTLYEKLVTNDTAPDSSSGSRKKKQPASKKASVEKKGKSIPDNGGDGEEIESPFADKPELEDSVDVPLEILIEHITSEGKEHIEGLFVEENGSCWRAADGVEDPDFDPDKEETHEEERGRGKRKKRPNVWYDGWIYTNDGDVGKDGNTRQHRGRCTAALSDG
jgi:hypothetical protein